MDNKLFERCAGQLHGARTISIALSLSHDQLESALSGADVLQLGCIHEGGIQPCLASGCRQQQDTAAWPLPLGGPVAGEPMPEPAPHAQRRLQGQDKMCCQQRVGRAACFRRALQQVRTLDSHVPICICTHSSCTQQLPLQSAASSLLEVPPLSPLARSQHESTHG